MTISRVTNHKLLVLFSILLCLQSCIEFPNKYTALAPGPWRGVLYLSNKAVDPAANNIDNKSLKEIRNMEIEAVTTNELPFIIDIKYITSDSFTVNIHNAEEVITIDSIKFGRSFKTAKDTMEIWFEEYNSVLKTIVEDGVMEGHFIDYSRGDYKIQFVAQQGESHRFTLLKKTPIIDLTGSWKTNFGIETKSPYLGEFQFNQSGNHLTATVTTTTGDYRFLEGTIQENKFYLSTFDGAHAFLFEGKIMEDKSITGIFKSGKHFTSYFSAKRGEAGLDDPFEILESESESLIYNVLKDSFALDVVQGKPLVVELMGTWCPNCKDASLFLTKMKEKHPDLEVIGLAFERKTEANKELKIKNYINKLRLNYPIHLVGPANKDYASQKLPFVKEISSFPSMFFIDKDGNLVHSYSGFYGPATSEFKDQINQLEKRILDIMK